MTALLDVDKLVRFSSSSIGADKLYKTLAYGLDAAAYFFAPTAQQETAQNIHALASNISMARYVLRFTGGLEAYTALKKGSWSCKDDDEHVQRLVRLQALSMVVYHPLEHVSYVGFVAPKLLKVDAMHFSRLSCRAWGVYVLLDIYASALRPPGEFPMRGGSCHRSLARVDKS
uniref:Uncharacterized protein n=1 Tax=Hyaloperonospora arabidopsidis (strain Emoy2) TaxID=559515 RepID=M4BUC1_HYAAE